MDLFWLMIQKILAGETFLLDCSQFVLWVTLVCHCHHRVYIAPLLWNPCRNATRVVGWPTLHSSQPQDCSTKSPIQQQGCLFIPYIRGCLAAYSSTYCVAHSSQLHKVLISAAGAFIYLLYQGCLLFLIYRVSILQYIAWPTLHSPKTTPQSPHLDSWGVYYAL